MSRSVVQDTVMGDNAVPNDGSKKHSITGLKVLVAGFMNIISACSRTSKDFVSSIFSLLLKERQTVPKKKIKET